MHVLIQLLNNLRFMHIFFSKSPDICRGTSIETRNKNITSLQGTKMCCAVCSNRTQDVRSTAWILMQQTDEI
jgi:hypothetical protein